jgi:hypothetical protein
MSFTFACYFPAENPLFTTVTVDSNLWAYNILEAVQVKLQVHRRESDIDNLRLFKVKLFFLWQTAN